MGDRKVMSYIYKLMKIIHGEDPIIQTGHKILIIS